MTPPVPHVSTLDAILGTAAGVFLGVSTGFAFLLARRFPQAKVPTFATAKEWMEKSWLAGLPSTNFKSFTTVVLYFATFTAYAAAVLMEKSIDNAAFAMWLAFLAGLGGFSLAQFKTQRDTDYGALDRKAAIERAKNSGAGTVIDSASTTVTGSPVTVGTDGDGTAPAAPTPPAPATPAAP